MKKNTDILKKKGRSSSVKAAATSLIVHALLILFAGSIVAVRYVQKMNAELTVSSSPPKLERRQLQMPAKLERVQQSTRRPRIVSRSVSVASPEFTAPDLPSPGKLSTQKFTMPFSRSGRDFSALTQSIGVSAPDVGFLGIRTKGEKFIFIIDGSAAMMADEIGGTAAAETIKEELLKTASEMPPSLLFNVFFHDGMQVAQFKPNLVPATGKHLSELREWIAPMLSDPARPGLTSEQDSYQPDKSYETAMGDEASGWLRALQAAFEQRPDNTFIVTPDWGRHRISRDKGQRLIDFSLWEILGDGDAFSVAGSEALRDDRELRDDLLDQAVEAVLEEQKEIDLEGDPQPFLRELLKYIQYSENQILDHADAVYRANYIPFNMAPPRVHVVRVVPAEKVGVADPDTDKLRKLSRLYAGELAFFKGAGSTGIFDAADAETVTDHFGDDETAGEPAESSFKYFGAGARGSRIAFLLDASKEMIREETGATNAYAFITDQLVKTVDALETNTLFNVVLYDGQNVALFRPDMIPVSSPEGDLRDWLKTPGSLEEPFGLTEEQNNYTPQNLFNTAMGSDVKGLPLALQAAMEQRADTILAVGAGLGRLPVAREKARRLLDFSIWDALGAMQESSDATIGIGGDDEEDDTSTTTDPGSSSVANAATAGGTLGPLQEDRRQRTALIRQAILRIADEKEERKKSDLPLGFVHDILEYVEYMPEQILEHLETVAENQYGIAEGPPIHFICLIEPESKQADRVTLRELRGLTSLYGGDLKFLRGGDSEQNIRRANRLLDLQP
jgi:hypothetical protein